MANKFDDIGDKFKSADFGATVSKMREEAVKSEDVIGKDELRTKMITLRVKPSVYAELASLARSKGYPVSIILNMLISKFIKEDGNTLDI